MRQHPAPQHADLLALRDAVGRDKRCTHRRRSLDIARSFDVPRRHIVKHSSALQTGADSSQVRLLLLCLMLASHKRRIAHDEATLLRRQRLGPIHPQRIAFDDGGAVRQRHAGPGLAQALGGHQIHLVIGDPQRHAGNVRRRRVNLDAVELIDLHPQQIAHVQQAATLGGVAVQTVHQLDLQQTQLLEGHHQEIAAAAGRIEQPQPGEPVMQRLQPGLAGLGRRQLRLQLVEKQRPDGAQDVALAGVMRPQLAPRRRELLPRIQPPRLQHRLEHAAEDRRADAAPVQRRAFQDHRPLRRIEIRQPAMPRKQLAVDVGEIGKALRQLGRATLVCGIEHLEQLGQRRAQIAAILGGGAQQAMELHVLAKDAGVVAKETEDQPGEQDLQITPAIAVGGQRRVQIGHRTRGGGVHARLFEEARAVLIGQQELEQLGLLRQFVQRAFMHHGARQIAEVVEPQRLEIAEHRVARLLAGRQQAVIALKLLHRRAQIHMRALVLDDQLARNEGIDIVVLLAQLEPVLEGAAEHLLAHVVAAQQRAPVGLRLPALITGAGVMGHELAQSGANALPVDASRYGRRGPGSGHGTRSTARLGSLGSSHP